MSIDGGFPRRAQWILSDPHTPRWHFNAQKREDMRVLGRAFGPVLADMLTLSASWRRAVRVGLCGDSRVGKTTLVTGMLDRFFADMERVEQNNLVRPQFVAALHHGDVNGHIRCYDAMIGHMHNTNYGVLSSYFNNRAEGCFGTPFLDIVEHPYVDKHNRLFDAFVFVTHGARSPLCFWRRPRNVMVMAHPAIVEERGFRMFLRQFGQGPGV